MNNLTAKEERFCQEYLIDANATASAKRAGYSLRTARQISARLLTRPAVKNRVTELMENRSARTEITQDMVLKELWSIATEDLKNFVSFKQKKEIITDPETGVQTEKDMGVEVIVKDSDAINTRNIAQFYKGKDGQVRIKPYDRAHALVQIGRHLGMFKDKIEHTAKVEKLPNAIRPIVIVSPYKNEEEEKDNMSWNVPE